MNFPKTYSNYTNSLWLSHWYKAKAEFYKQVATWEEKEVDEVFFDFSKPENGWIDMTIYSNGRNMHSIFLYVDFNPLVGMKEWMEEIADDRRMSTELFIEIEGCTYIFHYEHVFLAEFGKRRMFVHKDQDKDQWKQLNAFTNPDTGLFYVYDTTRMSIPVVCYCKTKQLLFALYSGLLEYASRSQFAHLIKDEWYYLDEADDNWTLYNTIKSPLIEWCIYSDHAYRQLFPKFNHPVSIKETVHMWAEWGDGLFWHQRGGCCGNAEKFFVDTDNTEIDLTLMPEVRQWYDEFDNRHPEVPWPDDEHEVWLNKGWELAKKIRLLLPESVDLFYQWKYYDNIPSRFGMGRDVPYIVPDMRTFKTDSSKFDLLLY